MLFTERGRHEELLARAWHYAKLVRLQFEVEEPAA